MYGGMHSWLHMYVCIVINIAFMTSLLNGSAQ